MIQTKGKQAFCSSVGDIKKHEKFKSLSKDKKIQKLQEVYDRYGVHSNEFFIQVKPFIMWTIYRHLRGMPYYYLEDLTNNAYKDLMLAFEGGHTTYYNKPIYKEPIYGTEAYYKKFDNIGNFVMNVVGSSVVRYRSRTFKRKIDHEDGGEDISERINYTDFEEENNLKYEDKELRYGKLFNYFTLNEPLIRHLKVLYKTKPKNNILYNFLLWRNHE